MPRAAFYIDGFNFYHAVRDLQNPSLKWMSYFVMATLLVDPTETVELVKLFSAVPKHRTNQESRHRRFHRAQQAHGVEVIEGKWKHRKKYCSLCKQLSNGWEEKESDVNLGIHLVSDAYKGIFDVAYIVTCDSDLRPAAHLVAKSFPQTKLVAVNTPGRMHSKDIVTACRGNSATVDKAIVQACVMPEKVYDANGKLMATRPVEYK